MIINNDNPDAVAVSERLKSKKRRRKRMLRLKFMLGLLLFVTSVVLLGLSPLFTIRDIKVYGNNRCKSEDLKDTSGLTAGTNAFKALAASPGSLLLLRYAKAEKDLRAGYPYLKEVSVKLRLPGTAVIKVKERVPVAAAELTGRKLIIDADGYILESVNAEKPAGIPDITGLKVQDPTPGREIKSYNREKFEKVFEVIQALQKADNNSDIKLYDKINYIDVSDLRAVKIRYDSRITVNFGGLEEMSYRMDALRYLLSHNLADSKGYLDFTAGKDFNFKPDEN